MAKLTKYDPEQTYEWNYYHGPTEPPEVEVPAIPGRWRFCGMRVGSPLGIPAGPLLNSGWIAYYAALGFDVLTYKTVRTRFRACYERPNLLPVETPPLTGRERTVAAAQAMTDPLSWAVSFGMPSTAPEQWRPDVTRARKHVPPSQVLVVSVVATPEDDWTLDQLADDYATAAGWAVEAGAQAVEANFSCPNVASRDAQLYVDPPAAAVVAERLRQAIGQTPLLLKIGLFDDPGLAEALVEAVAPHVDALSTVNCIAAQVVWPNGKLAFDGEARGIAGEAIRERSVQQVRELRGIIERLGAGLEVIGVGGIATAEHVRSYLAAGAEAVQLATAAMRDPLVALRIRKQWKATAPA